MVFDDKGLDLLRQKMQIIMPNFSGFDAKGCGELELQRSRLVKASNTFRSMIAEISTEKEFSDLQVTKVISALRSNVAENLGRIVYCGDSKKSVKGEFLSNNYPLQMRINMLENIVLLVDESKNIETRVNDFVSSLRPLLDIRYPDHNDKRYDVTRSFTTFLLMLASPTNHVCVVTGLMPSLCRLLKVKNPVKSGVPLDSNQYSQVIVIYNELYKSLKEWDWGPRDMIDVLFFTWAAK